MKGRCRLQLICSPSFLPSKSSRGGNSNRLVALYAYNMCVRKGDEVM